MGANERIGVVVDLAVFWLRDESLEESDNLPDPDILAQEIVLPRLASLGTPSSPEPQAEGTPSQDPRPARGPRRGVDDLEATLERFREIANDSGAERPVRMNTRAENEKKFGHWDEGRD